MTLLIDHIWLVISIWYREILVKLENFS